MSKNNSLLCLSLYLLGSTLNASVCNPYYPSAVAPNSYTTFTFANASQNAGVTAGSIYITMVGTTGTTGPLREFVLFDNSGLGSLYPAGITLPPTYSYSLNQLPVDGNGNPYAFVPNNLIQGIVYIGIDYGVALQTVTGPYWSIIPPTVANLTDANVYHLYDSVSFRTSPALQFSETDLETAYGLPLSILVTFNEGNSTYYLGLPPSVQRDQGATSVFGAYTNAVNNISNTQAKQQWEQQVNSFIPSGNGGATCYLHLLGPTPSMSQGTFDQFYLFDATYGTDWFNYLFGSATGFYQSNPLYIDVSSAKAGYTTYHYTGNSGGTLTFVPDGLGAIVTVHPTGSQPFFSNAPNGPFSFNAAGDALAIGQICPALSNGFVTGIFPTVFNSGNPLNNTYIQQRYVTNPTTVWGPNETPAGGPWYNLYASILHQLAPFSTTNNYSNINPESGDVSMGFNQSIPPPSASTTATVAIALGNMTGSVIPNFTDPTLYSLVISCGAGATVIYGTSAIGPLSGAITFNNVTTPVDLIVEYSTGAYAGLTYGAQAYFSGTVPDFKYAFVYPQPPAVLAPTFNTNPIQAPGGTVWFIGAGPP